MLNEAHYTHSIRPMTYIYEPFIVADNVMMVTAAV